MKNIFFGILVACFALLSCRSDEDSIQKIDQILDLYMKDASQKDLLHPTKTGAFSSISMNDALGETDVASVSYVRNMTADSVYYIQYIAGARRVLLESSNPDDKTYYSRIALALTKKLTDSTSSVVNDTLEIQYRLTPAVFEVSKVFYNKELKFTKIPDQPNIVTIIK